MGFTDFAILWIGKVSPIKYIWQGSNANYQYRTNNKHEFHIYRGADKSLARPTEKKQLKGRHFSSDAEVIAAAEIWLDGQPSDFFFLFEGLAKVRVWSL